MDQRADGVSRNRLAVTSFDIGLGALYFFASHMVIKAAFYLGSGRDGQQSICFLLCVLIAIAASHVCWRYVLKFRLIAAGYIGVPLETLLAGVGAIFTLISIVPQTGQASLLAGALFVGLAVGCFSIVLTSSVYPSVSAPHLFSIPCALLVAVGFYFAFRVASTVSSVIGEGFLYSLPLVTVACTARNRPQEDPDSVADVNRSLEVLAWVAAAFAMLGAVAVWVATDSFVVVESAINYRALSEALAVLVMLGCCHILYGLTSQGGLSKKSRRLVPLILVIPSLCAGYATASDYLSSSGGSLLWESSFWVLIVAIFAYDMKATPYSVDGVGVGPMFEAMAVGQVTGQLLKMPIFGVWLNTGVVAALVGLYLFGVSSQFEDAERKVRVIAARDSEDAKGLSNDVAWVSAVDTRMVNADTSGIPSRGCHALAEYFGLTEREESILDLLIQGRSASYIADTLGISFNTVRTHIRHIYEKLGVHSKQELIDKAQRGE